MPCCPKARHLASNAGMQACNTLRKRHGFGYPPPFRDSKPRSLQACIGLTGMGGFAPKEAKALLGMRQGSQICPAALVVQHRFRRPKKALFSAFRGRLRRNNHFGYPPTLRDSKPRSLQACICLAGTGGFAPKVRKSCLGDAPKLLQPCGADHAQQAR